jgi:hypothetical protein
MGTNCAPLLVDYYFIRMRKISYGGFSRKAKKKLERSFGCGDFVDRIYPIEREIKNITHTAMLA